MKPEVKGQFNLAIKTDNVRNNRSSYDAMIVPGSSGTRILQTDKAFLKWIATAESVPLTCSVCTGSLLLGAAGFLNNKRVTTHFDEHETLAQYGCTVVKDKIVDDGNIITAGAVCASLQLGLYLAKKWGGSGAERSIRKWLDVSE